jgi:simple sugar transport system substrate-binding protein
MMRTKNAMVALLATATLTLTACSSTSASTGTGTTAGSSSSPAAGGGTHWVGAGKAISALSFGTNVKSMGFNWFTRMEVGVKKFGTDTGIKAFEQGPSTADPAQQAQVAQDQLAQGIDALIVDPIDVSSMEPVMKQAMSNGVVVVTQEAPNLQNGVYDVEAFDNKAYGEHLMQQLAKSAGEQGQYAVFVGSLDSTAQNQWMDAAIAYQKANYPKMALVGDRQVTKSDQATSYAEMKQLVQTYPNLKGMIGGDAYDVVGAGQAVQEAGLDGKIAVLGTSIVSYAGDLMKSGAISAISTWDPAEAGYVANKVALMVLQGKKVSTGDDLGVNGFNKVTVDGKVITGSAWIDITTANMSQYNY